MHLALLAAEASANLLLGRVWWAARSLTHAQGSKGATAHAGLNAVRGRLRHAQGDTELALQTLEGLPRAGEFPLAAVVRSRNLCWYGEALASVGDAEEALKVFERSARTAPKSFWGRRAKEHLKFGTGASA